MKEYKFIDIEKCNMCGAESSCSKTIGKRLNKPQGLNPRKKTGITVSVIKCKKCGLIFSNPIPIPKNIEQHYGIPVENYWKDENFTLDENYFESQIKKFKTLYKNKNDITALDIGAGIGKSMISLKNAGITAYGIEPSKSFYEQAISKMKISSSQLQNVSIEKASFNKEQFDFITFGAVLEHLYYPSQSLKKAIEWLKPGGLIHIVVPSSKWLTNRIINFLYKIQGLDYVSNISPMHVPYHLYEFDMESFRKNSIINNYSIINIEYYVSLTFLPKAMDFFVKPIMKKTNTGMILEVWLRKN